MQRCKWAQEDPLLIHYHDKEWGKVERKDQPLFELFILELFQTGLSWRTVLHKREAFREAFDQFQIERVAVYNEEKIAELMQNPGIIRNKRKIEATVHNAKSALEIIRNFGSLNSFFMQLPDDFGQKLKVIKRHFKHAGPSVLESFLFAAGYCVPPHDPECFLSQTETYTAQ
ncbi:DNA-3-methyladenine glycosylase I [Pullulanibacillus sp. KACC 23026]|uniref:DNA-3-methyladenine glycosylase I n=1 Tax=Pullulanibacillus sp. KACC 23026 TaxID=3028315 RepID=UPI0023B07A21|nr:DNA-3-methyladenine glycosylase I [Pullulanibacillus sp. KACC 23026]WEG11963.1 DNA-3-methyladenine glycosylase I [Pullulanibacillus sp. KACC 23026]